MTAPTTATKSNVITNLNATPQVRATSGRGGRTRVMQERATITPTASQATSVLNRLVRVPSNCNLMSVKIILDAAATTLTGNIGLWFSDANDGTPLLQQGNLTAISTNFFTYQLAMATYCYVVGTDPANVVGLSAPVDVTFANSGGNSVTDGYYVPSNSNRELWDAVGQSTGFAGGALWTYAGSAVPTKDPGGFFDIGLQLSSTGSAANVALTCIVEYGMPAL